MTERINILVIEDDNDINQLLCKIVKKSNYDPQPAFSGTEALLYLEKENWDLVLLDLMLPGLSGEEILEKISNKGPIPVIIISAKNEKDTKISALRLGADDFISKPFDIDEVSARIDAVLRRTQYVQNKPKEQLTFKDIHLDVDEKTVSVNGVPIPLTVREYNILKVLMANPRKIFSKRNLFESVWKEPYHGDENTINVHVSNLRSKLSQANPKEEYIETIWGMGYRMKS